MWKAGDIKHRVQWEHLIVLSELNRSSAGGRNCLPIQEAQVQSLSWEDLLEEEMATHSNILAWEIPWTEEPGRLQSTGSQRVKHNWGIKLTGTLFLPTTQPGPSRTISISSTFLPFPIVPCIFYPWSGILLPRYLHSLLSLHSLTVQLLAYLCPTDCEHLEAGVMVHPVCVSSSLSTEWTNEHESV